MVDCVFTNLIFTTVGLLSIFKKIKFMELNYSKYDNSYYCLLPKNKVAMFVPFVIRS